MRQSSDRCRPTSGPPQQNRPGPKVDQPEGESGPAREHTEGDARETSASDPASPQDAPRDRSWRATDPRLLEWPAARAVDDRAVPSCPPHASAPAWRLAGADKFPLRTAM